MADVTFRRGVEENLPTSGMAEDGCIYQSTDTGNVYIGSEDGELIPVNRSPYYGTCATTSATNAKVVTLDVDDDNFVLVAGTTINVRFANSNTAASPTLNVNGSGAIAAKEYGTTAVGGTEATSWSAGEVVVFVYDGSYWMRVGNKTDLTPYENVQSDWEQDDNTADDYVKNRPMVRKGTNNGDVKQGGGSEASGGLSHAEGVGTHALGSGSHAEGALTIARGLGSHSEGNGTTASGQYSHAEGYGIASTSSYTVSGAANTKTYTTSAAHGLQILSVVKYGNVYTYVTQVPDTTTFTVQATLSSSEALDGVKIQIIKGIALSNFTHTEGQNCVAVGTYAHAEGRMTTAYGGSHSEGFGARAENACSHAEGKYTVASGEQSHAEGNGSQATALASHAEGGGCVASGSYSHAEGNGTQTQNQGEHAEGNFNMSSQAAVSFGNAGNTQHSIGIGTGNNDRKNAVEVMQSGDMYVYGVGGYDGTNYSDADTLQESLSSIGAKADKVSDALDGNLAGLDEYGNLADSGYSPSDFLTEHQTLPVYTVEEMQTPTTGYLKSYRLLKDGSEISGSAVINIPKDFLVKSGDVIDVVEYNGQYYDATDTSYTDPLSVSAAGKYIDFVVNVASGTATDQHIYIAVNDLVDTYTAGNGIDISNSNVVSVKVASSGANGLSVGSGGLLLSTAVASSSGVGGSAGAMSATDKEKLDGIAVGAEVNVQSDWNQTNTFADDYIKNKPTIPSISGLAVDSEVVHKAGDETIIGSKSFTKSVGFVGDADFNGLFGNIGSQLASPHSVEMYMGEPYDDGEDGVAIVSLYDDANVDHGGTVIIRGVNNPVGSSDAANKAYVDAAVAGGGSGAAIGNSKVFYGTCDTAAATTAKVVTCPDFTSSDLVNGVMVLVYFANTNSGTASSLTMNVNSTGAKGIRQVRNTSLTTLQSANALYKGSVIPFVYNGAYWILAGYYYNTTYSTMTDANLKAGTATTGNLVTAKLLKTNFDIDTTARTIKMRNDTLTVPDDANLVHITGAEAIYGPKSFQSGILIGPSRSVDFLPDQNQNEVVMYLYDAESSVAVLMLEDADGGNNVKVRGVATPTTNFDAANKKYVDDIVGDIETLLAAI